MFGLGNISDMMGKLQDMKKQMEEIKKRLDGITVEAQSTQAYVKVRMNGNRKVHQVEVSDAFRMLSPEQMALHLKQAFENAIEQADKVNESEMKGMASGIMPGLGSLLGK